MGLGENVTHSAVLHSMLGQVCRRNAADHYIPQKGEYQERPGVVQRGRNENGFEVGSDASLNTIATPDLRNTFFVSSFYSMCFLVLLPRSRITAVKNHCNDPSRVATCVRPSLQTLNQFILTLTIFELLELALAVMLGTQRCLVDAGKTNTMV